MPDHSENMREYSRLHVEQSGPGLTHGAFGVPLNRSSDREDAWKRCEAVIESIRALRQATSDLAAETRLIVAEHRALTAKDAGFLQHYVEGLARRLRNCDAPPERALILVKGELQPLIAAATPDCALVMSEQVVRWFVAGYYAA